MGLDLSIASLSTQMSMAELGTDIGVAVLDNSMDMIETLGDGMVKMMEASVTPHLGQNIDVCV